MLKQARIKLNNLALPQLALLQQAFFKTGKGQYAEGDQFIGVYVPQVRLIAKEFRYMPLEELVVLISSKINEERLLALIILVNMFKRATLEERNTIFQFYINNLQYVNNWNLVDQSAPYIVGAHLLDKDKDILLTLARSKILWERRVAMVATWYFIRNNQCEWSLKIAKILLADSHDLIHKAVGWMLREVGKKNLPLLIEFLEQNHPKIPRTTLRYAIEKFAEPQRQLYLKK